MNDLITLFLAFLVLMLLFPLIKWVNDKYECRRNVWLNREIQDILNLREDAARLSVMPTNVYKIKEKQNEPTTHNKNKQS